MPLVSITTNSPHFAERQNDLLSSLSSTMSAMLGKSERFVMVKAEHNPAMLFGGTKAPLAYVELKSIGLPEAQVKNFSSELCRVIADELEVFPDRIYIEFTDAPRHLWGWNGGTF